MEVVLSWHQNVFLQPQWTCRPVPSTFKMYPWSRAGWGEVCTLRQCSLPTQKWDLLGCTWVSPELRFLEEVAQGNFSWIVFTQGSIVQGPQFLSGTCGRNFMLSRSYVFKTCYLYFLGTVNQAPNPICFFE